MDVINHIIFIPDNFVIPEDCLSIYTMNIVHTELYRSYDNGSATRVSAAGWLYDTLEETRHIIWLTAEVTHNRSEGIET